MKKNRILIVEDDPVLNNQLTELLSNNGYITEQCFAGETGFSRALSKEFSLLVLDVMLPEIDGYTLLERLRKHSQVPVIMLTAKGAEEERIKGLCMGADDYVAKPFNTTELLLRIDALMRRTQSISPIDNSEKLNLEGLQVDRIHQRVEANGRQLELTPIQFKLLWTLMLHKGEVLTKAYLYQTVLKRSLGEHDRSLDMHLSRVRKKLKEARWPGERLQTVRGKGYSLT